MFRFDYCLFTFKGRLCSKYPRPKQVPRRHFCSPTACLSPIAGHGVETKNKDIDFDILFDSCHNVRFAKRLHALVVVSGRTQSSFISTKLLNLYTNLGSISFAVSTFDSMPNKNVYACNSMISAYVRTGRFHDARKFFSGVFLGLGVHPDFYTFPPLLKACADLLDVKRIHCWVFKLGLEWDVYVAASLVHLYCRFGIMDVACKLFDEMPARDMGSWNAMISGCGQVGNAEQAWAVLDSMILDGTKMNPVTVSTILPISVQMDDLLKGMLIHSYVIKHGLLLDVFVSNALINMYGKFGNLGDVKRVFNEMVVRDVVSWNSIIAAFEQNEDPVTAFKFYVEMQVAGFHPDCLTLVSLASIVAQSRDCRKGRSLHAFFARRSWRVEDIILRNAIVDMYVKLGSVDSAQKVFDEIPVKDTITWNTLITGYTQNGLASEAIEVFHVMQEHNEIVPTQGTWVSIIPAYAQVGDLQNGMRIHGFVIKNCLDLDIFIVTCLIDMYGKCGRLENAVFLFYEVPRTSSITWNTVISCHAIHGHGERGLNLFKEMLDYGVKPDHVTFVSLLSACSHSGLIDQAEHFFYRMRDDYGIEPSLKHYGCMVDLFARAGYLEKAFDFISNMPLSPDASIWGALLGACRIHGNVELGKVASTRLFEVDPENVGYYVLLSNMYANIGKWEGVDKVRSLARNRGLKKTPGWSSIEVSTRVDVFYSGNRSHPQSEAIYAELRVLTARMKSLGYVPDCSFVLQDVEDDEKEQILMCHSERLAIAFGIISTPPKTPIRIFKNLRVCGDCHNATKYISSITEREIVVRDSNRFHHFKDGTCSCGDYW